MIPEIAAIAIAGALALDMLAGDPPSRLHPTAWVGAIYGRIVPRLRSGGARAELVLGAAMVVGVCAAVAALLYSFEYAASTLLQGTLGSLVLVVAGAVLLKTTIAVRGMQQHAMRVARSLESGDIECARGSLAMIVKRRTGNLDRTHLISGALESVSENTSDGITGPIFYFALFGLPGAFVYRAVNTADSMVGYKNGIFSNLGRFAAACDTALNIVPARLTAYSMVLAAAALGLDWKNSHRTIAKYASCTGSANSGYPMAALAGALRVTLEKPGHYAIRGGDVQLQTGHVRAAVSLMKVTVSVFIAAVALPAIAALSYAGWWQYV